MRKKIILLGIVQLLLLVCLCGCNESNTQNRVIGTWSDGTSTFTFTSDGTYSSNTDLGSGTFEAKNARLTLTTSETSYAFSYHFPSDWKTFMFTNADFTIDYNLEKQ